MAERNDGYIGKTGMSATESVIFWSMDERMTTQEWWRVAGVIFEEEKKRLDSIDPDLTDPEEVMTAIRRTLQRLEKIGKPRVQ